MNKQYKVAKAYSPPAESHRMALFEITLLLSAIAVVPPRLGRLHIKRLCR
jgi:hypothetical protein